jgi:putative RecB family exonuclease
MAYHLSAAKLQTYDRCPQAYYFRYERGLRNAPFYSSAALGTALHQALAQIYRDWHYQEPIPDLEWIETCWAQQVQDLSPEQILEGRTILRRYYELYILSRSSMRQPIAVEGKIQATLQVENIEFVLTGRYDRLDALEAGLELIDYKSSKTVEERSPAEVNLQLGLYYLALEQRYLQQLQQLTLIYLRSGEQINLQVTPDHKHQVHQTISDLAVRLRSDENWQPTPGDQCSQCGYARYCPAMQSRPEPLPEEAKPAPQLQLTLGFEVGIPERK